MQRERLQLALERIRSEQWKLFEEFASAFLSTLYPDLRTLASLAGDQGRDAELFSYDGKVHTVLQYSVAQRWTDKIRLTAQKISKNLPDARVLIYVTNQSILSAADSLKRELLDKHGLVLDIHDTAWFLDRFSGNENREIAAETLAAKIVDPYLASKGVLEHTAPALSNTEYQAALTFLQLQWEDDTREKGLTRLSFQALVRAVLRSTNSESRMHRTDVHKQIVDMFPNHDPARIKCLTDSALNKLTKRYIRHWKKSDEFCLTYEEVQRVRERLAEVEVANISLDSEIQSCLAHYGKDPEQTELLCVLIRSALDRYLFGRGEAFAAAITNNRLDKLGIDELRNSVEHVIRSEHVKNYESSEEEITNVMSSCIVELLTEPSMEVQNHLRSKADAYTLFAFLGRTTDVQTAVSTMFSHGEIWLDTTIVLPLFAERLISTNRQRRFSQMLNVASQAGLELRITPGVIEEIERHLNRCQIYLHMDHSRWTGSVPFLADAYLRSGRAPSGFGSWTENFMGAERPEDDIADFLKEFFAIRRKGLEEEVMTANVEMRTAIQEAWHSAHTKRRSVASGGLDEITIHRLVRHDVENYLGVVELRRKEGVSALGYSAWWLTLDRSAGYVDKEIRATLESRAPATPVMSADFLVNYLSIGPIRSRVAKNAEATLPIALDMGSFAELPSDLLDEAVRIRWEAGDLPEHIVRRRVRDCLDRAKRRPGHMVGEGIQTVLSTITPDTV